MAKGKSNSCISTRLFLISTVLVIAIGGMTLFVCTAVFSSSEKDVSLFKRAAFYIKDNVQSTLKSSVDGFKNTFIKRDQRSSPDEFPWKDIRLPKDILPVTYRIYLKPDLATTFDFTGRVAIDVQCVKPTKYVILHFKKLDINSFKLLDSNKKYANVSRILKNQDHEQILLETQEELQAGKNYTLKLTFSGKLSNSMAGFYKSSYKTKEGKTKYLATTQFESTDARAAFPCFDEPDMKAIFQITVAHKKDFHAISNMPVKKHVDIEDDCQESHFEPSVKMSTYLVAFIVSDFKKTETFTRKKTKIRVWSAEDNVKHTKFALDVAEKVLSYYEKFFEIPYPLPKLDLVAVPDFAAGAMENWGLMTFRETYLLSNDESASSNDKQDVAIVVSHELAHQWFGNLVTMKWWNDLWLNEGFANFVEYIGTHFFAKEWKVLDQFVCDTHQTALQVDSMKNTHPISVPVNNPSEITEIFDTISYNKGSSVIRMLKGFMGDVQFKRGLKNYLKKHRYANAEADDLWSSLSTFSKGLDVKAIMDTWIKQEGYPVVTIMDSKVSARSPGKATKLVQQNRFFRDVHPTDKNYQDEIKGYNWIVPLTYITADQASPATIWMNKSSAAIHITSGSKWIKANVGQVGYYRVNYDQQNWENLIKQLKENHTVLAPTDRSGLLDDSFNLARAGYIDMNTALEFTSYLNNEKDYIPWATALRNLGYIGSMFSMKPAYSNYEKYMINKMKPLESYVGWENKGDNLKQYLRSSVLSSLASHSDNEVVDICLNAFNQMMNNKSYIVGTHVRGLVYHTAIKHGGIKEWEFLWSKYQESIDPTEKSRMLGALSGTRDTAVQMRFLENTMDDSKIRAQDITSALAHMGGHSYGRLIAWDFFRKNFKAIIKRAGKDPMEIGYMLTALTRNFNDEFYLKEVENFVKKHEKEVGELRATKKVIEGIKSNIAWMKAYGGKITDWLEKKVKTIN